MKSKLISLLLALMLVLGAFPFAASADEAQDLYNGILSAQGASSPQSWLDGTLSQNAGTMEWYAFGLAQKGGYDFTRYRGALEQYLAANTVGSASSRLKYALVLIASGSNHDYIYKTLNDSIGKQGVMSWIYGLHLLNNGYPSEVYTLSDVKQKLLSLQLPDGGWAVMGSAGDVDATAMALQALAPHKGEAAVKAAIEKGLTLLSARQQAGGDYMSYGAGNPESTVQVLIALCSLGIDCTQDARFIKNGNTLFDGIGLYRLADGSFCHQAGGTSNGAATAQVFYGMVAYERMKSGKSSLYLLDARNPTLPKEEEPSPEKPVETPPEPEKTPEAEKAPETAKPLPEEPTPEEKPTTEEEQPTVSTPSEPQTSAPEATPQEPETAPEAEPEAPSAVEPTAPRKGSYKPWAILIIAGAAVIACLALLLLKRKPREYLLVGAVAVVAVLFVLLTNFQSVEQHSAAKPKENVIGIVQLSIDCGTVREKGEVLPQTAFSLAEGETVYDILLEATAAKNIHLETSAGYVQGIDNLYEMDHGELSGWVYLVNGTRPGVGCDAYTLQDGDIIEWHYSLKLGEDIQ